MDDPVQQRINAQQHSTFSCSKATSCVLYNGVNKKYIIDKKQISQ